MLFLRTNLAVSRVCLAKVGSVALRKRAVRVGVVLSVAVRPECRMPDENVRTGLDTLVGPGRALSL